MKDSQNGHVHATPGVLQALRTERPPSGRVLSAYFDTSPDRAPALALPILLRDHCQTIRSRLGPDELDRFEAAVARADRFLQFEFVPTGPGLALFVGGPSYCYSATLPKRPLEVVAWGEEPLLAPIEEMLDDCERIAVVLFDKARARVFSIYLGAIEERQVIEDPVPGKQATGGWFALAQSRYERHHEDHVLRHARRVIAALMARLRARPFDRLLLAGPPEALVLLKQHLPRPLRDRFAGTLRLELFTSDAEVLRAALEKAEAIERQEEQKAVSELIEAASTPHVALGLKHTLAALNDGRVHRLFLAHDFEGIGGECERCGRLMAGLDRCAYCGGETRQLGDLRERLLDRAIEQGARVEFVSGDAASLLTAFDGIGAWTRY